MKSGPVRTRSFLLADGLGEYRLSDTTATENTQEPRLILTDDLIRDALTADKKAKAERAANENFEDEDSPIEE